MDFTRDKFMRMIVFFDLPVKTKEMMKQANKFRKLLLNDGFQMLQLSVYSRIIRNDSNVETHLQAIKKHIPPHGSIRVLTVTEKQYASMEILVGEQTTQEKKVGPQQLLLF